MTTDLGWLREQLGKWHPALGRGEGDIDPFWRRIWRLRWGGLQCCVKSPRLREETAQEVALLRSLYSAGYPVPRVHWADEEAGLFVMEWVEGPSLEDLLKQPKGTERDRALATCVRALAHLEAGAGIIERVAGAQAPATSGAHELAATLLDLASRLAPGVDKKRLNDPLGMLAAVICAEPRPILGIVDVLPRDVVVGRERVVFLDHWPVGWWWSEKRFCQYFARFQQDPADRSYQSECFLAHFVDSSPARLDAHYLWHDLSYLNAWQEIRDSPEETKPPEDILDSIIAAARHRLGWHGHCPAASEVRALLRANLAR